ncbi:hypothetical protein BP00DRAFT_222766 [Aspergillus indologenus CBS 114.80]|uniref:Uncharacterized protein n=1 Tax=Aspergillus indologenus CBS 114.80 TaxID=1450541 RepID=A0A2V5I6G9_9EURO|nr:hypothetical protein BP00DRAFT_222766 [Aspergillus indologenus CBS 114.80]
MYLRFIYDNVSFYFAFFGRPFGSDTGSDTGLNTPERHSQELYPERFFAFIFSQMRVIRRMTGVQVTAESQARSCREGQLTTRAQMREIRRAQRRHTSREQRREERRRRRQRHREERATEEELWY